MIDPILCTKLYIPARRDGLVSRPRLLEKLDRHATARLLLVAAPAGFGKTTLVAEWVAAQKKAAVAWLSLDEHDDDPGRFYAYLVAALQTVDPALGRSLQETLRSSQLAAVTPESVVTLLLNDLAQCAQAVILVLDDYHTIRSPAIHQAIQFWLDNQPPGFCLALTSRSTPPLALSRLRVRHTLVEIDADDLRFTSGECADFLNQVMKLDLTPEDVRRLAVRTEGWIASIHLAALSLQGDPDPHNFILNFAGDDRFVMDYLMEEVLQRQPGYIRDFLLQTSILRRLNVQLCNAVTGQVGGQQVLEDLDQRNLFVVPLDNRRHWYRYHQLFAEFLRARLQRISPDEIPALHGRAAHWYAANGHPVESVDHALLAGDFSAAADLMAGVAEDILWREGQFATFRRWIEILPAAVRNSNVRLALLGAWALYAGGRWESLEQELHRLEQLVGEETDASQASQWQGELLVLRAERAIFGSDIDQARRLFQQAEAFLAGAEGLVQGMLYQGLGYIYRLEGEVTRALAALTNALHSCQAGGYLTAQLFALYDRAAVHRLAGNLNAVLAAYVQMEQIAGRVDHPIVAGLDVIRGQIFHEQARLDAAEECLEHSLVAASRLGMHGFVRVAHLALARLYQSQGRAGQAQNSLESATQLARRGNVQWIVAQIENARARLLLAQGRAGDVDGWAAAVARPPAGSAFVPRVQQQQTQIIYARYLLATGAFVDCAALLDSLAVTAEAAGWGSHLIEIYLLAALCAQARGETTAALAPLGAALGLGETAGYVQLFVDDGPALWPLLEMARRSGASSPFADALLARIPAPADPSPIPSGAAGALTRREAEILRLVATGLSNQEIADRLTIALGTVGKHTSNIFVKLDAANRAAAVLRAGELGLL